MLSYVMFVSPFAAGPFQAVQVTSPQVPVWSPMLVCVAPQMGWLCTCTSDAETVTTMQSRAHRHRVRVRSSFLWFMMYAPLKCWGYCLAGRETGDPSSVSFADTFPPGGRLTGVCHSTPRTPQGEGLEGCVIQHRVSPRGKANGGSGYLSSPGRRQRRTCAPPVLTLVGFSL